MYRILLSMVMASFVGAAQAAGVPGVSDTEIVMGTHQDLSGPISAWGVGTRNGMQMAFDEINEAGGIHGRTIKLIVEDTGYDSKKAVIATIKLLNRDQVFGVISTLGSPTTLAAMPQVLKKNRLHLFPLTAAEETYEPFHPLKFSSFTPYQYGIALGTEYLMAERGYTKVGLLSQDDEFGENVAKGAVLALKARGMEVAEATTYKRGATDFATQIAKLRAAGVDLVVLGTVVRETVGAVQAAGALGWDVQFLCSTACYTAETLEIGGAAMDGVIATGQYPVPYPDDSNLALRAWLEKYEATYPVKASSQALIGYANAKLFAAALEAAGRDVTVEGYVNALEDMEPWELPDLGGVPIDFTAEDHMGAKQVFLAEAEGGRWKPITDKMAYEPAE